MNTAIGASRVIMTYLLALAFFQQQTLAFHWFDGTLTTFCCQTCAQKPNGQLDGASIFFFKNQNVRSSSRQFSLKSPRQTNSKWPTVSKFHRHGVHFSCSTLWCSTVSSTNFPSAAPKFVTKPSIEPPAPLGTNEFPRHQAPASTDEYRQLRWAVHRLFFLGLTCSSNWRKGIISAPPP